MIADAAFPASDEDWFCLAYSLARDASIDLALAVVELHKLGVIQHGPLGASLLRSIVTIRHVDDGRQFDGLTVARAQAFLSRLKTLCERDADMAREARLHATCHERN